MDNDVDDCSHRNQTSIKHLLFCNASNIKNMFLLYIEGFLFFHECHSY